jgi:antitoxin (DNA-binding transcriptional repressor) of toxin-antitoxin stability system
MQVEVRDVSDKTRQVVDAIQAGERVALTVDGEPVADIVPRGRRMRWLRGDRLREQLRAGSADPALSRELDRLVGRKIDEL